MSICIVQVTILQELAGKIGYMVSASLVFVETKWDGDILFDLWKYENMTQETSSSVQSLGALKYYSNVTWLGPSVSFEKIKMKNWRTFIEIKAVGDWQKRKSITLWSVVKSSQTHWKCELW